MCSNFCLALALTVFVPPIWALRPGYEDDARRISEAGNLSAEERIGVYAGLSPANVLNCKRELNGAPPVVPPTPLIAGAWTHGVETVKEAIKGALKNSRYKTWTIKGQKLHALYFGIMGLERALAEMTEKVNNYIRRRDATDESSRYLMKDILRDTIDIYDANMWLGARNTYYLPLYVLMQFRPKFLELPAKYGSGKKAVTELTEGNWPQTREYYDAILNDLFGVMVDSLKQLAEPCNVDKGGSPDFDQYIDTLNTYDLRDFDTWKDTFSTFYKTRREGGGLHTKASWIRLQARDWLTYQSSNDDGDHGDNLEGVPVMTTFPSGGHIDPEGYAAEGKLSAIPLDSPFYEDTFVGKIDTLIHGTDKSSDDDGTGR